jgi:hypothetical protein
MSCTDRLFACWLEWKSVLSEVSIAELALKPLKRIVRVMTGATQTQVRLQKEGYTGVTLTHLGLLGIGNSGALRHYADPRVCVCVFITEAVGQHGHNAI